MKFEKRRFKNGLRVVIAPMEGTDTVTLQVFIGTGSHYENRKNNGISHFLEHMFFKGTKNYPKPGEFDRQLDAVGAVHNAFTSREETSYWIKASSKRFPLALKFVSEILQNALMKEEEINRERGVILEEMKMYWDIPQRYIWSAFEELVYGDNEHGWDTIGTPEIIKTIKRKEFLDYWKSQYVASNALVVISGNILPDEVFPKVEKAFSNLRKGSFKKSAPLKKIEKGPRIKLLQKNTDQTHIALGCLGYELKNKNRLVAEVLATILGGYMSSRLFMELRERHGLTYALRAMHDSYRESGYLAVYIGVPHERREEAVERMIGELRKIKKSGITNEELSRAKENMKGSMALSLESSDEVAMFLGMQELLLGKIKTPDDVKQKIDTITKEDVNRVAKSILRSDKTYLTMIGPDLEEEPFKKILKTL